MISFIIGFVSGGLSVYLIMRNNPKLKVQADEIADAVEKKIDEKRR